MTPLLPPRGRSPHHFSGDFFEIQSSPHQNWKIGRGIPSPRFGAGIGNALSQNLARENSSTWFSLWYFSSKGLGDSGIPLWDSRIFFKSTCVMSMHISSRRTHVSR